MGIQITMTFESVHGYENNPHSQSILNERREDFNHSCWEVLMELINGKHLNVYGAAVDKLTSCLPRRIKDLRDHKGIPIVDEWIVDDHGKRLYKEYYIAPEKLPSVMSRLIGLLNPEKPIV